ncbi:TIGR01244 family sulfur transferase [Mesorhizobium sp. INR15]|uniref:TIGR01244 family sulfur transferase n=1 Tax=Mesorhizobium sp. INR15 TaxID=2654248 RepID=UPI001896721D|nr:TIGR01244 family sulfur transferase [Mesorhizobium sp. INR15]QPC93694.1 TIGR01244 family phosphatase [Mesorhizobium sp. INR15]
MEYREISEDYSVSGQIQPEDVAAIKAAGFKSIICNRPDDEQPGQPSADTVKAAVTAAGLAFRYIPVISGQMTAENVEEQAEALDELEGPVFAYCRSGARCTNLFAAIQQSKG